MTTDIGTINTPRLMAGNESNSMAVNIEAVCATSFHLSSFLLTAEYSPVLLPALGLVATL